MIDLPKAGNANVTNDLYGVNTDVSGSRSATNMASSGWTQDNWEQKLIALANKGDQAALDKLISYYSTRANEKTARDWTAEREDTYFDRMMAQARRNGISPYALSGLLPGVSAASSSSFSGSQMVSQQSNKATTEASRLNNQNTVTSNILKVILSAMGTAILAVLLA